MNEKQCTRCKEIKPLDQYYKQKKMKDGKQTKCKECSKSDVVRWQQANQVTQRRVAFDTRLWQTYKLRTTDVEQMLVNQEYRCKICTKPIDLKTKCVDHDHSCCNGNKSCGNCVRGLLCRDCNFALGWYEVVIKTGLLPNMEKYLQ